MQEFSKRQDCQSKLAKVSPEEFRFRKVLEMDFKMLTTVKMTLIEQRRISFATEAT